MNKNSTSFVFGAGSAANEYMGLPLWWHQDNPPFQGEFEGWASTPKGLYRCKIAPAGWCRHVDGIDNVGKTSSFWEVSATWESEIYRGAGISACAFRSDARVSDFPFFLTNLRGSWVHETSLIARLSVERLGDLPEVQRELRVIARWNRDNGFDSKPKVSGTEAISERMMVPVEWGEMPRACVGAVHLRRKLNGRDWLVDYYGVHGFEMDLVGAELTHTVFDRWDTRKNLYPPGSLEFQRAASLPEREKYGNVRLSVEYGAILGKA